MQLKYSQELSLMRIFELAGDKVLDLETEVQTCNLSIEEEQKRVHFLERKAFEQNKEFVDLERRYKELKSLTNEYERRLEKIYNNTASKAIAGNSVIIVQDGYQWCAFRGTFKNLQESMAAFGDNPITAVASLLDAEKKVDGDANGKKEI